MWEKTVFGNKKLQLLGQQYEDEVPTYDLNHYLLSAQAEHTGDIAFKAGEAQAYKKWEPAQLKAEKLIRQAGYDEGLADGGVIGVKMGRQEVVEWLQIHPYYKRMFSESPFEWDVKRAEWGIKE